MTPIHPLRLPLSLMTLVAVAGPLAAQDEFGRAVAVGGTEVLVLKPGAGRGPAAVYVYQRSPDGTWRAERRLRPADGEATGEGLSHSMAAHDGILFVGSGDAAVRGATHVFHRTDAGTWDATETVSLPGDGRVDPSAVKLDFAAILRILQPPPRIVATDGRRAAVAVPTGPLDSRGVWILERGSGGWTEQTRLRAPEVEANDLYGAAVAIQGDRALVGAPRHGASGAVFVFGRDARSGEWRQEATLVADTASGVAPGSGLGAAVAFDGEVVLVGVPGTAGTAGRVVSFVRDSTSGTWTERTRVSPVGGTAGDEFGSALAIAGNELWIGAPGAAEARGRIYRFLRHSAAAEWRLDDAPTASGVEPGFALGRSIALAADVAVAGAPSADGGVGRAAVFTATGAGGWAHAEWLMPASALPKVAGRRMRCEDGEVAGFACHNVDLLAFLPIAALGGGPGEGVSDLWGWTDPATGREYALVGRSGGVAIVDITNPTGPAYVGVIPANRSGARDIKVYENHLFFTGDGAGKHGLLVFDLTRLRAVRAPPVTFEPDARYTEIASAHNLIIDTESGFAFTVGNRDGGNTCGGGLHMIDIRDPLHPAFAGCYTDTEGLIWPGRTHDAQCITYRGPDEEHRGRQICFASNETALRIVDVTDKETPLPIAAATYPGISYVHQGWLTDDQRYFYLDDELDELLGRTDRTRTLVWDVVDLDDPVLVGEFRGQTGATDHNLYVKGDRMYQANYYAGLRVVDISDPEQPVEIGYFDTTPYEGNPPGFGGAWTAFPFFESETVIVSSMREGLFVLAPRPRELVP